jgi:hypothetical protein
MGIGMQEVFDSKEKIEKIIHIKHENGKNPLSKSHFFYNFILIYGRQQRTKGIVKIIQSYYFIMAVACSV